MAKSFKFLIAAPCLNMVTALSFRKAAAGGAQQQQAMVTDASEVTDIGGAQQQAMLTEASEVSDIQDMSNWRSIISGYKQAVATGAAPTGAFTSREELFDTVIGMYDFLDKNDATRKISPFRMEKQEGPSGEEISAPVMEKKVREIYLAEDFNTRFSDNTMLIMPERLATFRKTRFTVELNLKTRQPIFWGGKLFEEEVLLPNLARLLSHYDATFKGSYNTAFKGIFSTFMGSYMDETEIFNETEDTPLRRMQAVVDTDNGKPFCSEEPSSVEEPINFAISGPVKLLNLPASVTAECEEIGEEDSTVEATAAAMTVEEEPERRHVEEIHVTHIWGVNLESTESADYYKLVLANRGRLHEKAYAAQVKENFELVFASAKIAHQRTGKKVSLRIPLIGLGAYLKTLGAEEPHKYAYPEDKKFAIRTFYKTVFELAVKTFAESRGAITTVLCVMLFDVEGGKEATRTLNEDAHFGIDMTAVPAGFGGEDDKYSGFYLPTPTADGEAPLTLEIAAKGNLFSFGGLEYAQDTLIMLANAWDSNSLIGNRMYLDPTVDGFVVADAGVAGGRFHPNNIMQNTSYLQNPMFNAYANGVGSGKWWACSESGDVANISATGETFFEAGDAAAEGGAPAAKKSKK